MKSTLSLIIFVSIILSLPAVAQDRGWRGIVPLHSTRKDVEALIGPPMKPNGITYDLKDERVNIEYSALPCTAHWPYGWNVPRETVTSMGVFFKRDMLLADLHLDLSRFTKFINPNIRSDIHYTNNAEGFSITAADLDDQRGERVVAYEFFPVSTERHMMCPEAAARELEIERGESSYLLPVLYYSDVSPSEEKVRLEVVVDELKNYPPDSRVYIIGYAGRESCPNEALKRASDAKDGLVKLGINAQRIVTIDGGHKSSVWKELYLVKPGDPKPLSTPDIYPKDVRVDTTCSKTEKHASNSQS